MSIVNSKVWWIAQGHDVHNIWRDTNIKFGKVGVY